MFFMAEAILAFSIITPTVFLVKTGKSCIIWVVGWVLRKVGVMARQNMAFPQVTTLLEAWYVGDGAERVCVSVRLPGNQMRRAYVTWIMSAPAPHGVEIATCAALKYMAGKSDDTNQGSIVSGLERFQDLVKQSVKHPLKFNQVRVTLVGPAL